MTESGTPIARAGLPLARRLVVKVGSSSLTNAAGFLDVARLRAIVGVLAVKRLAGCEVVLVTSGAQAAALGPLGLARRPRDLATAQAAASVGQGLLIARYAEAFAGHRLHVGQVLLTADDVIRRSHYRNAHRTLTRLLALGVVPVVNENDTVATSEIRFGDNDRLAALVAHLVRADALLLLTDVDALYTAPPDRPGARRIARVDDPAQLAQITVTDRGSAVGTGGMASKVDAARLASASGIPTLITSAARAGQALGVGRDAADGGAAAAGDGAPPADDGAAAAGDGALPGDGGAVGEGGAGRDVGDVGTWFVPTGHRVPIKRLWLAHAADVRGRVVVDDGAARAVRDNGKSLLLAGAVRTLGQFEAGEPVEVARQDGRVFARGLVGYGSGELPPLLGRSSAALPQDADPVLIHRDELVLLPSG